MHCPLQNIQDTIQFTKLMEKLKDCQIDPQEKCPACAIVKSTRQDNPGLTSRASIPFTKLTLMSSSLELFLSKDVSTVHCLLTTALVSYGFMV